jgi:hypothetical protein
VQRAFPQNALRGAIVIGVAPEIQLNGAPPGSRRERGSATATTWRSCRAA